MKITLVSAAVLAVTASTANAQMTFESGSIDLGYYAYQGVPGLSTLTFGARGDYSIGPIGLQLDGSGILVRTTVDSLQTYSVGGHVYKELANGSKIGAYATYEFLPELSPNRMYAVGVEGIASFGPFDIEAAIGATSDATGGSFGTVWAADVDTYYEISPSLEVNVGILYLFGNFTNITVYNAGLNYTLANIPVTIGASYLNRGGSSSFNVNASFVIGPKLDERLFSSRQYPLYIGF